MGFRVVERSSLTFETDLPPSSRNIHPSGILHAFRSTRSAATAKSVSSDPTNAGREEHAFAWIANSLHIESALSRLEERGFDRREGMVFIPYSTKRNWLDRYPHAEPSLECTEAGTCDVPSGWHSHLDDKNGESAGHAEGATGNGDCDDGAVKKRKYKRKVTNMLRDDSYVPDAERDELHVEIYNYLSWLHAKLIELEVTETAELEKDGAVPPTSLDCADGGDEADRGEKKRATRPRNNNGVDVSELGSVLEKLELTFAIIPHVKLEAAAGSLSDPKQRQQGEQRQRQGQEGVGKDQRPCGQNVTSATQAYQAEGTPFLEDALSGALGQLVAARELAGKPRRRSRKRIRQNSGNPNRQHSRAAGDFDEIFQRLVRYKEEHGHCAVPRGFEDQKLSNWVNGLRVKKSELQHKGIDFEEIPPGKRILAKSLTSERLERLNSIGFVWSVAGPKVAWEDRFRDCMEYYEENGRWPSQSMGSLGEWVHKQRTLYAKRDANFMKNKAQKLDEVGFEWTPRGNTRMTWEEGYDMLMEYGRINGHYDVPCLSTISDEVDVKSNEYRFYRWVESLHSMYRSYKLGRQSGSLTDHRVVLLIKHGFSFRNL